MTLRLSYSGAQNFLSCRMKWFWNYEQNICRKETSRALEVGQIVHQLIHQYYTKKEIKPLEMEEYVQSLYPDNQGPESALVAREALTLIGGYFLKYEDDPLEVISSEVKIEIDRIEPITQIPYRIYCIVDAIARTQDKRLWRLEHKTSSRLDTYYLNGLRAGLQGGIYHYTLNKTMPEPIVGTIYNLLVKTKIPQYQRMPVLMANALAERAIKTFDGVARQIHSRDFFPDAGSCFQFSSDCPYLTLCNNWKGEWDEHTLRIKESFYKTYKREEVEPEKPEQPEQAKKENPTNN